MSHLKFDTVTIGPFSLNIYWKVQNAVNSLSLEEREIIEVAIEEILLEYTKNESTFDMEKNNEINKLPKKRN